MERPDLKLIREDNNRTAEIIHARAFAEGEARRRIESEEWFRLGMLAGTIFRLCDYIEYLEGRGDAHRSQSVGQGAN